MQGWSGCTAHRGWLAALLLALSGAPAMAQEFSTAHVYALRPDPRLCPGPVCGGYWVRRVNRQLTRCVDGSEQAECYVAALRHVPAAGLGGGEEVLVQGRIRPHDYAAFGTLGVFAIDAAWRAVNMAPASGRYVAIEGNGIVCITSPCFSWDESVLNRGVVRQVSAIDLTAVTGDPASLLPADGGVLVAAGLNRQVREAEGLGLRFEASQVFVEIAP